MKKKFLSIIVCFFIVIFNMIQVVNAETGIATITVEYQYNEETNTVLATIRSDIELDSSKPTWTYGEDKKSYSFEFNSNTTYMTKVTDIYGNVIPVQIKVTQVIKKQANVTVDYEYKEETNTVITTIKSDIELQSTKASWTYGEDKKSYSYEFNSNTTYTTKVTDIYGNVIPVQINVTQVIKKQANVTVNYEYKEETNTVIATIKSDIELQSTKASWTYGEDKKSYSFEFNSNTNYMTKVTDIYGNIIPVQINVTQVIESIVNIEYEYKKETNTVIATIRSNIELESTKASWTYGEDKKSYSFEFNSNTNYTTKVTNIFGKVTTVHINVTQVDDKAPIINVEYVYNDNNTVTAILHSNEILANTKPNWTFSEDQKSFLFIFNTNIDYSTKVQDIYGNETWVRLTIKTKSYSYTYNNGPNITVRYLYDSNGKVLVQILSDKELKDTKTSWTFGSDKKSYSFLFNANTSYITKVEDIDGNVVNVCINVDFYKNTYRGIDVSSYQGIIDWNTVKKAGIDYAIIRVGYRGWGTGKLVTDDCFERNIQEAARVGIDIGIYFYSQAINTDEAKEEARYAINVATKYNIKIKFPIVIDSEKSSKGIGRADNLSRETRTAVVKAFCEEVKMLGYTPMIYASKNWLYNNLAIQSLSQYDVWLAHYTDTTDYKYTYTMWQYTSSGSVNGITGNVDMNVCYKKY